MRFVPRFRLRTLLIVMAMIGLMFAASRCTMFQAESTPGHKGLQLYVLYPKVTQVVNFIWCDEPTGMAKVDGSNELEDVTFSLQLFGTLIYRRAHGTTPGITFTPATP